MMRSLFALGIAALLTGCGHPKGPAALGVPDAWVRLAAVPSQPSAGYFTIQGGPQDNRLISVTSAKAASVELHTTMASGDGHGMMAMKPLESVDVPAGKKVEFKPGQNHAMLFSVDPSVKAGGTMPMTFHFASGAEVTLEAHVIGAGDPDPGAQGS